MVSVSLATSPSASVAVTLTSSDMPVALTPGAGSRLQVPSGSIVSTPVPVTATVSALPLTVLVSPPTVTGTHPVAAAHSRSPQRPVRWTDDNQVICVSPISTDFTQLT